MKYYQKTLAVAAMLTFASPVLTDLPVTAATTAVVEVATTSADVTAKLKNQFYANNKSFTIDYGAANLTESAAQELVDQLLAQDPYIKRVLYDETITVSQQKIVVTAKYLHSVEDEAKLETALATLKAQLIKPNMATVEKVIAFNTYFLDHYRYGNVTTGNRHSPYTLITEQKGTAQAYASLMQRLLEKENIPCDIVTGLTSLGESHMWNIVQLNGKWYHLDPLWEDTDYDTYTKQRGLLLVSHETITTTGMREVDNYPLEEAASATDYFPNMLFATQQYRVRLNNQSFKNFTVKPVYVGDTMYYLNVKQQFVKAKNGVETVIADGPLYDLTYANGKIFYLDTSLKLHTYNIFTGEIVKVLSVPAHSITIDNNEVIVKDGSTTLYKETVAQQTTNVSSLAATLANDLYEEDYVTKVTLLFAAHLALTPQQIGQLSDVTTAQLAKVKTHLQETTDFKASLKDTTPFSAPKVTTNAYKPWTITLSNRLNESAANAQNVVIYDMFGNEVPVDIHINGKKITVTPLEAYHANTPYTLWINKSLQSATGKTLKDDLYVQFSFE